MGFGNSVIQRLVKTSIKKNLYYEIKDKVIEERFNGVKLSRQAKKVKVYGLDSTREIRARLIELLYERVNYHKDKFIARILHDEMQGMTVKPNGKVEHSTTTHDDQVFSYLMAIYVWYDGQNLMERYNIMKNSIKTDEDLDEAVEDLESSETTNINLEAVTRDNVEVEDNKELKDTIEFFESSSKQRLYSDFERDEFKRDQDCLIDLVQNNPLARDAYAKKYNLNPNDASLNGVLNSGVSTGIPTSFFLQFNSDTDDIEYSKYCGNLGSQFSSMFDD